MSLNNCLNTPFKLKNRIPLKSKRLTTTRSTPKIAQTLTLKRLNNLLSPFPVPNDDKPKIKKSTLIQTVSVNDFSKKCRVYSD